MIDIRMSSREGKKQSEKSTNNNTGQQSNEHRRQIEMNQQTNRIAAEKRQQQANGKKNYCVHDYLPIELFVSKAIEMVFHALPSNWGLSFGAIQLMLRSPISFRSGAIHSRSRTFRLLHKNTKTHKHSFSSFE